MSVQSPLDAVDGMAVIAHRGASRAARENTLEAFAKARALRADAVELDVRRAGDGALVVHHDPTVEGLGALVTVSLAEIRAHAPWIPTLDEAFDACEGMWVNVEIKNLPLDPDWDPDETLATAVAELVGRAGIHGRVVVSSFNPGALAKVRDVDATIATGLLTVGVIDPMAAVEAAAEAGHAAIHPDVTSLGDARAVVVRAGELGLGVVPWTVDDADEIVRLAEAGVVGVITNVPDVARRALGS